MHASEREGVLDLRKAKGMVGRPGKQYWSGGVCICIHLRIVQAPGNKLGVPLLCFVDLTTETAAHSSVLELFNSAMKPCVLPAMAPKFIWPTGSNPRPAMAATRGFRNCPTSGGSDSRDTNCGSSLALNRKGARRMIGPSKNSAPYTFRRRR